MVARGRAAVRGPGRKPPYKQLGCVIRYDQHAGAQRRPAEALESYVPRSPCGRDVRLLASTIRRRSPLHVLIKVERELRQGE